MQQKAEPGEVLNGAVLGLAAQPLLKPGQDVVVPSRTETANETTHERIPATAHPHAGTWSDLVDQLVPRCQHGKIMPFLPASRANPQPSGSAADCAWA